jgi:hypothetical protein
VSAAWPVFDFLEGEPARQAVNLGLARHMPRGAPSPGSRDQREHDRIFGLKCPERIVAKSRERGLADGAARGERGEQQRF